MTLLADPVFQLNLVLWLLQPLPQGASIRPVLRERGYKLDSIEQQLELPLTMHPAVRRLVGTTTPASPDVVAAPPPESPWLILECKAHGFGLDSASPVRQAVKLLAAAPDVGGALGQRAGEAHPGLVVYLTTAPDHARLIDTLTDLRKRLEGEGLRAAEAGTLGIEHLGDGIYLLRSPEEGWPAPLQDALEPPLRVIELIPGEDPRPLYLIPWDPGVPQEPEEKKLCQDVLRARLLAHAAAALARIDVPARPVLSVAQLLTQATFGAFDHWRARGTVDHLTHESRRLLEHALQPLQAACHVVASRSPDRIQLTIESVEMRSKVCEALARANPTAAPPPQDEPGERDDQLHLFALPDSPAPDH